MFNRPAVDPSVAPSRRIEPSLGARWYMQARAWTFGDLARSTVVNHVSFIVDVGITLLLTPLVYQRLGPTDYGLWILVLSQISLLGLLDLDLHDGVIRSISDRRRDGSTGLLPSVVANALVAALAVGLAGSVLVALFSRFVVQDIESGVDGKIVQSLLIAGLVLFCCEQLSAIPEAILLVGKRYVAAEVVGVCSGVGSASLTAAVLLLGYGLVGVAVASSVGAVVGTLATFTVARWRVPELPIHVRRASRDRATWRPFTSFFAWSSAISLAMLAIYDADTLLIGTLISAGAVAAFGLAVKIPQGCWAIAETTFGNIFPYSADLYAHRRPDLLRRTLTLGTRIATSLSGLSLVGLWLIGPDFLRWWLGPVEDGETLLRLALVVNVVHATYQVGDSILYGCAEQRSLAKIYAVSAFLGLPLLAVLIAAFGVRGAIYGSGAVGVLLAIGTLRRVCALLQVPTGAFTMSGIVLPLLPVAPAMGTILIVNRLLDGGLLPASIATAAGLVVFAAVAAFATFPSNDRDAARRYIAPYLRFRGDDPIGRRIGRLLS